MFSALKKTSTALLLLLAILSFSLPVSAESRDVPDVPRVSAKDLAKEVESNTVEIAPLVVETSTDPRADILNSLANDLNPSSPQSVELDAMLEDILAGILTDEMTTYQKTKACYDYLVENTTYGSHMRYAATALGSTNANQIIRNYGNIEGYGAIVLNSHVGYCNAYASAFILMAREIGLDARLVVGSTKGAGGGYVQHQWAEITIDGVAYVFDPQLEQNLTRVGLGTYNVFCKTYSEVPGRYIKY